MHPEGPRPANGENDGPERKLNTVAIGYFWSLSNLILGLLTLQLASIWLGGGNVFGRGLGFILHGVSG